MRRRSRAFLALLFALFLGSSGFALSSDVISQVTYRALLSNSELVSDRKGGFDILTLRDGIRLQELGAPDLPVKVIHLLVPEDGHVAGVLIANEQHVLLDGEYSIPPCQPDSKTDGSSAPSPTGPDPSIYSSDSTFPGRLAEVVGEGYLGGNHVVAIALYPLQYRPKSGQLSFYTQIDIGVEMTRSDSPPLSSHFYRRSAEAQQIYQEMLYQLVDNKDEIPGLMCRSPYPTCSKSEVNDVDNYSYVVVTSEQLRSAFLPLVDWKTKKGVKATIVCMDSILSTYQGRDQAEKLRNFLKEAYQQGTSWVLLGGDEDVVPIRYAYPSNTSTTPQITDQQICDLYFSDVDGEWDLDNDGVWGEPQQDRPDLYPDLFVGRVPCNDTSQVKAFVEKLLSYEENPGDGSTDYLTRALWMSSDQMRDWSSGSGQQSLVSPYVPSNFSQDLSTLIETPSGSAENPTGPEGDACIETMNQGWGIIGVLAHGKASAFVAKSNQTNGNPKSWVSTAPGEKDGSGHIPNLQNESKYGIMYSISCSQSAIDVDKYPSLGGTPCVGEFYPLVPQKGGVAFLGYSRWGWVSISYILFEKFLDCLLNRDLGHHIGVAEALSRCAYPNYLDIDYGHNLFGDPEMPVWTRTPANMQVIHPDETTMGQRTIDLSVISQGESVPDASVCLSLRGQILFLGKTDQDGHVSAQVNINDVGEMSLVVTKPDLSPCEDSISVTLVAGVNDDQTSSSAESFELLQNYPNPFNPVTDIQFNVKGRQNHPVHTSVKIYNILGQLVTILVDEPKLPGSYVASWDGKDSDGRDVSSGIYFYTLAADNFRSTKKMTLIK
ncbi:MAG: C25 family cysteine peptidase [Candidatus Zixiibacteriota bacterium]